MTDLVDYIEDDNASAPEIIPTTVPAKAIFKGWGHSVQCKSENDDVSNV